MQRLTAAPEPVFLDSSLTHVKSSFDFTGTIYNNHRLKQGPECRIVSQVYITTFWNSRYSEIMSFSAWMKYV